ncbi:hypothetical protein FACS1894202_06680 [Clostridia bacterium]|nr:hypothetical protein FACS1894202_06680 [Clostridia bacterium]
MKRTTKALSLLIAIALCLSLLPAAGFAETAPATWDTALADTQAKLLADTKPEYGSEWVVVGLARADVAAGAWYDTYKKSLKDSDWDAAGYSKVILALTALGADASGYVTKLAAMDVTAWSVLGEVYALLALDSGGYLPDSELRGGYIAKILGEQSKNGDWGGTDWGLDITLMTIQALTPYYAAPDVKAAVDNALSLLKRTELASAEENAQAIVALTALGLDPSEYVTALLTYYDGAGGFTFAGETSAYSTEQAAYALTAYARYLKKLSPLYDMRTARAAISVRGVGGEMFFASKEFAINGGVDTALSLLLKTGLAVVAEGGYVSSINGLADFQKGPASGWMYRINKGAFPKVSAAAYVLRDGDVVDWVYTLDLGGDVGDYEVTGGWYNRESLDFAVSRKLVSVTDGKIDAGRFVTRAEFVTAYMKLIGITPLAKFAEPFTDLGGLDAESAAYLNTAKELGYVSGAGGGTFNPGGAADRAQSFVILYNILSVTNSLPIADTKKTLSDFADGEKLPEWAKAATAELVKRGLITGDGKNLNGGETLTVGQLAQLLYNL